jgi:hypothetical protein
MERNTRTGSPRWPLPVLVAAATAGVILWTSTHGTSADDGHPSRAGRRATVAVPIGSATPAPGASIRFSFDHGMDGLTERAVNRGNITLMNHGGGLAVVFPRPCTHYDGEDCPRAVLESELSRSANPGTLPLRWGATVRLTSNETTSGSNIVQKGFSSGGSQFKLQVDGHAGRPSCTIVGEDNRAHIYLVPANVSIADGGWHQVGCSRTDSQLSITVDGIARAALPVPSDVSVLNGDPVCIGGKGTGVDNDQFSGAIDDVYVQIDR